MNDLEVSLNNWEFDAAKRIKKELSIKNFNYFPEYCKFLADTGDLSLLRNILRDNLLWLKESKINDNFKVCSVLFQLGDRLNNSGSYFSRIYAYSIQNDYLGLLSYMKKEWDANIHHNISHEDNMILNFSINKLVESRLLDNEIAIKLINHLFLAKNINPLRKKFLVSTILKYVICDVNLRGFFVMREQFYNHLQKLLSIIHYYSNEAGGKNAIELLYNQIKINNNLSLISSSKEPKVAVLISGMCKEDIIGLNSIFDKIVKPLNADVFMHTWDIQQDWMGKTREFNFWVRAFGLNKEEVPVSLLDLKFLEKNYPNIYSCLLSNNYSELNLSRLKKEFEFTELVIENQDEFMRNKNIGASYLTRGHYNQVKMFYGIHRAFDMMQNFERENNFKYDYVIRVRPDLFIVNELSIENMKSVNFSELAVSTSDVGIADGVFYATRETYESIVDIWNEIMKSNQLSPFIYFPKYDCHALLLSWMIYKGIKPTTTYLKASFTAGLQNLKVPKLKQALFEDCNIKVRFKYPKETEWLESFLKDKAL